jgi:hypothetical protein
VGQGSSPLGHQPMTAVGAAPASADVISLSDERASIRRRLLQRSARDVAERAFTRAEDYDEDGAYPAGDVAALHESGLLTAVLLVKCGGAGLTGLSLSEVLFDWFGQPAVGAAVRGACQRPRTCASLWKRPTGRVGCGGSAGRKVVRRLEHRRRGWTAADSPAWPFLARRPKDPSGLNLTLGVRA